MMRATVLMLCGAGVFASASLAQFGAGTGPIKKIYEDNCMACHGERGQGGGAGTPSFLTDDFLGADYGKFNRKWFDAIKNGKKDSDGNPTMDVFGKSLSDPQIWGLVAYIRELQHADYRKRVTVAGDAKGAKDGVHTSVHHTYKVEDFSSVKLRGPWGIDWLPDGRAIVTEKRGDVRIISADGKQGVSVAGMPKVVPSGQGGMMAVTVHPDYGVKGSAGEGWVYLGFSDPGEKGNATITKIVRGKIKEEGDKATWTDQQDIFKARNEHYTSAGFHFGTRVVFTAPEQSGENKGKRHLFFSIGDRGQNPGLKLKQGAQLTTRPNGKIYRLWDDGSVPADNPLADSKDPEVYKAIWSWGHRNPQALTIDNAGRLWNTEHGPRGGDELNLIEKGRNYGWPVVSYGMNYNGTELTVPWTDLLGSEEKSLNVVEPVYLWLPSIGACGMDTVRPVAKGATGFAKWEGDLLAGGLSGENVTRIRIGKDGLPTEAEEIVYGMGRVRDVRCGPDGMIYVILNDPDKIIRLVPTGK